VEDLHREEPHLGPDPAQRARLRGGIMTTPPGLVVEVRQEVPLFDFRDRGAEKWLAGWMGGRNGV
jgi:hypothetical protein